MFLSSKPPTPGNLHTSDNHEFSLNKGDNWMRCYFEATVTVKAFFDWELWRLAEIEESNVCTAPYTDSTRRTVPNCLQLCFSVCPDCTEDSKWESRGGDGDDDRPDQMREQDVSGGLRRSKRYVRKPSVQTETKYIELMVVNDNEMVSEKTFFLLNMRTCDLCWWSLSSGEIGDLFVAQRWDLPAWFAGLTR